MVGLDKKALEELVRAAVAETLQPRAPAGRGAPVCDDEGDDVVCKPRVVPPARVADRAALRRIAEATPARLVQGRVGTRYLTATYVGLRAEHAIALDAVHSAVPDDFAARLGCVPLHSRAVTHEDFLLHPDLGRRLDDQSKEVLLREGTRGVDVQVIAADGLAAWAILDQGIVLVPALQDALQAQGFSVGKPLFVKHARIGVQDEVGVLLGCKSTVILVGERPGLGTGDSLSIYTAFRPRLGQDNAEKNCISNIRPLGTPAKEAALECARLMRRTFDAGGGGVHLVRPLRDIQKRTSL